MSSVMTVQQQLDQEPVEMVTNQQRINKRIKLVEGFILYAACAAAIISGYMLLGGTYPFNAFLASLFCNLSLVCLSGKR